MCKPHDESTDCIFLLTGSVQIRDLTYPVSLTWIGEEDGKLTKQTMAKTLSKINRLVENEKMLGDNRNRKAQ